MDARATSRVARVAGSRALVLNVRQTWALFRVDVRRWWRRPRHLILSIVLSTIFLVVTNHLLVIWLGSHVFLGLHTDSERVARTLTHHFSEVGLRAARCASEAQGLRDLERGAIVGLMSITGESPQALRLTFSGRNPLLDRELAGLMLSAAAGLSGTSTEDFSLTLVNSRYTPQHISAFMAAGTLPFLILLLTGVFSGVGWLQDWESQTLQQFLVTPAPRATLVVARALSAMLFSLAVLVGALIACRPLVTWPLPQNIPIWFGVMAIQALAGCGVYFAIAAACRSTMLFNDVTYTSGCILMFVTGVFVPVETMPPWERTVAYLSPTFYAVRSMRAALASTSEVCLGDLGVMVAWAVAGFCVGYTILRYSTLQSR
jgi:ABC-type multidrug transport system permease subunit